MGNTKTIRITSDITLFDDGYIYDHSIKRNITLKPKEISALIAAGREPQPDTVEAPVRAGYCTSVYHKDVLADIVRAQRIRSNRLNRRDKREMRRFACQDRAPQALPCTRLVLADVMDETFVDPMDMFVGPTGAYHCWEYWQKA